MAVVATDLDLRVKTIVCRVLELELDEVSDTTRFTDDLGADSMSAIELLASLEREFDIEIAQGDMVRMINLVGVRELVSEALEG